MSDWKEYKLGELATFYNGRAYKNGEFKTSGTPIVRIQNLTGEGKTVYSDLQLDENKYIENGDLIYAWSATFGPYIWRGEKSIYHYHIWKIVCNEKIIDKFYFYYKLKLISDSLKDNGNGSIFIHITKSFMENFKIKIPSLEKQKYISNILSNLDKKIRFNTQINQTLEEIAQALFKSWFVDFDPVRAKAQALSDGMSLEQAELAAMQAISGKKTEELTALSQTQPERYAELAETAKAFPCEFGGDGVPMGWNISIIGQEVETVGGATPSTKEEKFWNNGEIAWTTPKDLSSATSPVLLKTERKITESGLKKISSGLLSIGTVLLSSRAPVGYLSLAQIPVAINQGYIAIKCNKSLNNYYMLQWCKENLEEIKGRASGTTFLEISKTTFRQIPIIVPDGNILSLFEKQCSSIYQSITVNTKENIYLEKTRDLLLPRLLNGEI